jgi:LysM repeat protein
VSRGGQETPKNTGVRGPVVNNLAGNLANRIAALVNANNAARATAGQPSNLTLGQIEAIALTPLAEVNKLSRQLLQIQNDVGDIVALATNVATQPTQIANRCIQTAQNALANIIKFVDEIGQVPYELRSTKQQAQNLFNSAQYFGQQVDLGITAAGSAHNLGVQLRTLAQPSNQGKQVPGQLSNPNTQLQQVHICKAGDTPQSVSSKYYGSPDHAADILQANDMSWYTPTLPAGKIIIIPALSQISPTTGV